MLGAHSPQVGRASLVSSRVPTAGSPGCAAERHLHAPLSPLGSASLAAALLAGVSRPGSQEDLGSNQEPARSLVGDAVSGAEIAALPLALAVARLPLCL